MAEDQALEPNFDERDGFPPAGNKMATRGRYVQHVSPGLLQRIYRPGIVLAITEHIPPEPFRPDFYDLSWYRKAAPEAEVMASGQLGWCLKYPQVETQPKEGAQQHSLKILQLISGGYNRRSQVFKCQLDGDEEKVYMAKAYDPAFSAEYPLDVTWAADASYSTEAAAYEDIKRFGYDGTFSPKYYGSWTFNLPFLKLPWLKGRDQSANTRPVRMILMEYIEGLDFEEIFRVKVELLLSPQERLYVLNDVLKATAFLQFAGVSHRDPFPRNVILRGSSSAATDATSDRTAGKVVIIDFEHAVATRRPNCLYAAPREDKPINPIYRHWRHSPTEWFCLVPEPFFSNYAEWQKWMKDSWLNNRSFSKPLGMEIAPWDRDISNWFPQFA
ncbi:unnamed protein product [Clonostachys byssicola]|uniref:Protein kinase domain-containing protein n=1 Tax=Clonostachys byssicola TaxID=160290 RepID=A0A9N9Y4B5_9HYPO|nr:unnamed protein product [Clonostachys byssicola]